MANFLPTQGLVTRRSAGREAIDEALNLVKTQGDKRICHRAICQKIQMNGFDLSLKSILKRAVDEGYDRVAFLNGGTVV